MVEISLSGSGEGPGEATTRGYSTTVLRRPSSNPRGCDPTRDAGQRNHLNDRGADTAGQPFGTGSCDTAQLLA